MSEEKLIPAEMLDAAAEAVIRYEANLHSCSLRLTEEFYGEMIEAALRAAGVPALAEDAATFRHLLNIARQVYGFEMIGEAFTKIDNLRADVKLLREGIEEWREWIMSLPANQHCSRLSIAKANVEQQAVRIAELEAELRNRICEGCDKLMANVGQLHLCGCQDQRNLCSACKAECACAGGK
jgi:hypothetical protein